MHAHVAAKWIFLRPAVTHAKALGLARLTPSEIEVLRWTREGKTAEVAAQILDVKVTTVNSYIKLAMEKLDVTGSMHKAAQVAAALGLL